MNETVKLDQSCTKLGTVKITTSTLNAAVVTVHNLRLQNFWNGIALKHLYDH